jgi:hypothetical protein
MKRKGLLTIILAALVMLPAAFGYARVDEVSHSVKARILLDLTHAERVSVGDKVSPDLYTKENKRIVPLDSWAFFLKKNGFSVGILDLPPITSEKLEGCDILVIAEADRREKKKPAYFSTDEVLAIKGFVERGGSLLLVGDPLIRGEVSKQGIVALLEATVKQGAEYLLFRRPLMPDIRQFMMDFRTRYYYSEVLNDLTKEMGVGIEFCQDIIAAEADDCIQPAPPKQLLPRGANIWIEEGQKDHPLWEGIDRFGYIWGCSLDVTGDAHIIATAGEATFTSAKTPRLDPIIKEPGSYPVVMAEAEYGKGRILALGDLNLWEGDAAGSYVFDDPSYNGQRLALNVADYLSGYDGIPAPM